MRAESDETARVEAFIRYWQGREGGQERANYGLFLIGLCDALGLPRPEPASSKTEANDYVFERAVKDALRYGSPSAKRIDLYRRGAFILEAKQSRWKGERNEIPGQSELFSGATASRGKRTADRAWDVLMRNARQQAEDYVRLLPQSHEPPPFLIVCDVGQCFEIYANFRRDGKVYDQFPDRRSFRVFLEDLRDLAVRDRLRRVWTDPLSLDPARHAARVTRVIAERLAAVSKALDKAHRPEDVAMFLMRCLFTMFAEDVELLPKNSFRKVLERCETDVTKFRPMVEQLWEAMDKGEFAYAIEQKVKRFNGAFFKQRKVLPLGREEIGELRQAASHDWRDVDPSIFGTLLEQALDPDDRRRLGAHYTPRAYVERLVVATVIEPLRADWAFVVETVEKLKGQKRTAEAIKAVRTFHDKLCATRILDPACGTGNFLYVSLELLKRLEGEVLEALAALGGQEALSGLEGHSVDPHQFLGMEINPRAAAIAELVLWIGHLQWQLKTVGGMPSEPILRAFKNIQVRDAVLDAEMSLARDASGKPVTRLGPDGAPVETYVYKNPKRPEWPAAEFIVGNPPFIGGKDLRARLGAEKAEALWKAHAKLVPESADFVMYWWDRAAELLTRKGTVLRRFGFVTTNSISQVFQRRVMERHLSAKKPVSLVMAVPDHPWTKAAADAAAVRIAMTVVQAGSHEGLLREILREAALDTDTPVVELSERKGAINSDLTIGIDVAACSALKSNDGLAARGVVLHGAGFIVTAAEAAHLGLGRRSGLELHIRQYRNGRDLTARSRNAMVIDLFGLQEDDLRRRYPEVYQHVKLEVKEKIIVRNGIEERVGRDWNKRDYRRLNWWLFGENIPELRQALSKIPRYIATVETTKHRVFQFLDAAILPDNKLVAIGSADAADLGVLSSRLHGVWALRAGGWLGVGNDPVYVKSRTFDPFPFPAADDLQKQRIRAIAEELDAHRKRVLDAHPHLTLTGLYNVLERLRAGAALTPDERRIFDDGLVLILQELHDRLDAAVAAAYGWPADLADDDILARLVALNKERATEEARGLVRWLRPDYQVPRFGSQTEKAALEEQLDMLGAEAATPSGPKPLYPTDDLDQTIAVWTVLSAATAPLDAATIAATFKQGRRIIPKIESVLAALTRIGRIATADGKTFVLKHAA